MIPEPVVFNGKHIIPGISEDLARVITFLTEMEKTGSFVYGNSVTDWGDVDELIKKTLGLGSQGYLYAKAIGIAYIVSQTGGHIDFPAGINEWSWASALSFIAPVSGWDASCVTKVIESFHASQNRIEHILGNAVRLYSRSSFDNGLLLLDSLPSYKFNTFAGLMEGDFDKTCHLFPPIENQELFMRAFVHTTQIESKYIYDLYDSSTHFDPFDSPESMDFLLAILAGLDDSRKKDCENRIMVLLQKDSMPFVLPICNWAIRQVEPDYFFEECIIALIKGLATEDCESYLKTIDHAVAIRDKGTEFLERVVLCVAENLTPLSILSLDNCIRTLSAEKEAFQNLVLFFIMHPKGLYRMVGRRIWDDYHMENSSFDPTNLNEELQCFFILFMLQDFGNPETRLPKIVPLFNSKSKKVLGTLVNRIRPYADEYMGHVIKVVENLGINTDLTCSLKKYIQDRQKAIDKRTGLKELSPKFAQYEVYCEAVRSQNTHFKEAIDRTAKETESTSFLGMLKKQVLARGGGWRKDDGTTQHLIPFEFSLPRRIMEQSMMPLDRIKWVEELLKDYEPSTRNS